ncbi:MAG TPA: hypothetical protein VHD90_07425 [Phototrophicaceae bacterium]|nr:hypothetical protein [Phototrophicaceae bacterium]
MTQNIGKIEIGWDTPEHTVVHMTMHDGWTWEALYQVNPVIIAMMSSTDETVHLLIDYMHTRTVPMGGVIMHARNILTAYPPNCDLLIIVTRNMLVQRLASIFQSTFRGGVGSRVYSVTSYADADRLIRSRAQSQLNAS